MLLDFKFDMIIKDYNFFLKICESCDLYGRRCTPALITSFFLKN